MEGGGNDDPSENDKQDAHKRSSKLQADVEYLEQKNELANAELKAEDGEEKQKFHDDREEIKNLQSRFDDLRIRLRKGLETDEGIIQRAFIQHSRELRKLQMKSPEEVISYLDGKVLDMVKFSNLLEHSLRVNEEKYQNLNRENRVLKQELTVDSDEGEAETETDTRIRGIENEYMKLEQILLESQVIQIKQQNIRDHLKNKHEHYPTLLNDLEEEYEKQTNATQAVIESEAVARERRNAALEQKEKETSDTVQVSLEKKRVNRALSQFTKNLKPREIITPYTSYMGDTEKRAEWKNLRATQENEMRRIREDFKKIKQAINVVDIEKAESVLLTVQSTKKHISNLISRTERRSDELVEELEALESTKRSIEGSKLARPKLGLEEELKTAKEAQTVQAKRKADIEEEQALVQKLSANMASLFFRQASVVEEYAYGGEQISDFVPPDKNIKDMTTFVENAVETLLGNVSDLDVDEVHKNFLDEKAITKAKPDKLAGTDFITMGKFKRQEKLPEQIRAEEKRKKEKEEQLEKKRLQEKTDASTIARSKKSKRHVLKFRGTKS